MNEQALPVSKLLSWFSKNQRALPWRQTYEPYHVWISEIMLQQTRVEQMLPYFERFLKRFPNVQMLASASEQEVLKHWEGLGYYSRARNLHKSAKRIVENFNGQLPSDYKTLLTLPGFGPYISAAVASIAFNRDCAVVDGNVFRVLSRVFGITDDIRSSSSRQKFQQIADEMLPSGRAREFNQALMELGALVCIPEQPLCAQCPLKTTCYAFLHSKQYALPVSSKKPFRPLKTFAAFRVVSPQGVWLTSSQENLLRGLYSFPLLEFNPLSDSRESLEEKISKKWGVRVKIKFEAGRVRHDYTHFRQVAVLFDAVLESGPPQGISFFSEVQSAQLPCTKLQHKLRELQ